MIKTALDFLAARHCTPIGAGAAAAQQAKPPLLN
jgi:hypothetical protein